MGGALQDARRRPAEVWRVAFPCDPGVPDDALLERRSVEARLRWLSAAERDYEIRYQRIYRVHQRVAANGGWTGAARRRCGAPEQSARRLRAEQRHPRRGQSRRQARQRLAAAKRTTGYRPLRAPAPRRHCVDHVQAMSIRNKRLLEERDPVQIAAAWRS